MIQILFTSYSETPVPFPPRSGSGRENEPDGDLVLSITQAVERFAIAAPTLRQLYADSIGPLLTPEDAVELGIHAPTPATKVQPLAPTVHPGDLKSLRENFCVGVNNAQFELFVKMCNRTGLDPFTKQIYWAWRPDRVTGQLCFNVEISIAGLRLLSIRTGELVGTKGPFFSGDGKAWVRAWNENEQPTFARFGAKRRGQEVYQWAVADWDAYVKMSQGEQVPESVMDAMWLKFGYLCLARCAEALCRRMVFPEIGTLYTDEEMQQSDNPRPATPAEPAPAPEDSQLAPADDSDTQLTEPPARQMPARNQAVSFSELRAMMRATA